jgi:hypothetical protein
VVAQQTSEVVRVRSTLDPMTTDHRVPLPLRVAGELLVIVAGVLIALWVDNLNQNRKDALQEDAYLAGILIDLASDSASLANRHETATRGLHVADRLLALRRDRDSTAPADSLAAWFLYVAFVDNFQVLDHTYREILGAGGLSLIRDQSLRRQISAYYRSIESAEFFTDYYKGEEEDYWDLLGERLSPEDFIGISRSEQNVGDLQPARLLSALRGDPQIANAIEMNRHWTALRLGITERRLAANRALATTLRDRLGHE